MRYEVVVERAQSVTVVVEADNEDEAADKAVGLADFETIPDFDYDVVEVMLVEGEGEP